MDKQVRFPEWTESRTAPLFLFSFWPFSFWWSRLKVELMDGWIAADSIQMTSKHYGGKKYANLPTDVATNSVGGRDPSNAGSFLPHCSGIAMHGLHPSPPRS